MANRDLPSLVVIALSLGLLSSAAAAPATLTVTYTTQPHGGNYAPRNVVAVWVEDAAGNFVRTIDRWAASRRQHLVAWTLEAGAADADAVSGATRANHTAPLTATWDLVNRQGVEIGDGTYTIRMELADSNASLATQNAQGTFTFTKSATASTQSALSNGGFSNVSIAFTPATSETCNNGTIDTGETCDPAGSCPTTCADSGDPCMVNTLVGSAATCTAACVLEPVTGGDCGPPAAGDEDNPNITGGCAAGGAAHPGAWWLLALGLWLCTQRAQRKRRTAR